MRPRQCYPLSLHSHSKRALRAYLADAPARPFTTVNCPLESMICRPFRTSRVIAGWQSSTHRASCAEHNLKFVKLQRSKAISTLDHRPSPGHYSAQVIHRGENP